VGPDVGTPISPSSLEWEDSVVAKKANSAFDPNVFLAEADGGRKILNYRKGQIVFSQGDPANAVFFIQSGRVKLTVISKQGKEAVVAFLGAGDFIGEGCLGGRMRRMSTASAMTECVITGVDRSTMIKMLREEPKFSELFTSHVLARAIRVEEDLVDQLFNSSEKRLARTLCLLANFGKEDKPEPILAKVTQETLAEMVGTTRSRVSHFMNKFRQLGLIEYNGELRIHPSLLDVVLNDQPQINQVKSRK
jgi:CRP/FNR family transcriptional regulator, cyclic AMP receptor protein